jgi:C4-dicarboxylate transporter DctQ subunit
VTPVSVDPVESVFERMNRPFAAVSAILVLAMMLTIVYDTMARLVFSAPTLWVLDMNEYSLVYLTFLPAAWILMRGGHVRVEILLSSLSRGSRTALEVVSSLLGVAYCAILSWQSWVVAAEALEKGYRFSTALALPRFPIVVVIPIGAAWLGIGFAVKAWVAMRHGAPVPNLSSVTRDGDALRSV